MDNRITAFEWITVDSYKGTLTSGTALVVASPLSEGGLAIYAKCPTHRTNSEAISCFAKVLNTRTFVKIHASSTSFLFLL